MPETDEGYATAHRTGIIGQVFRTEKPILAPDVRNHPLYDPFDDAIDWELCFPVFVDEKLTAVVNLEGAGALEINIDEWIRISRVIEEVTKGQPPATVPKPDASCLIETHRVVICAEQDDDPRSDIVEMAKAIASGGKSTLLVGDYPDLLLGRGPNIAEASRQGLGVSYCYFGVEQRLDLLATGPAADEILLREDANWWNNCRGRYSFVLLQAT